MPMPNATTTTTKRNRTVWRELEARHEADALASEMERVGIDADHDAAEPMQVEEEADDAEDDGGDWRMEEHCRRTQARSRSRSPPPPSRQAADTTPKKPAKRPRGHHRVYGTCTWQSQRTGEGCDREVAGPEQAELMLCNGHYRAFKESQRRRALKEALDQNPQVQAVRQGKQKLRTARNQVRGEALLVQAIAREWSTAEREGKWFRDWQDRGVKATATIQQKSQAVNDFWSQHGALVEAANERAQQAQAIAPRPPAESA